MGQKRNLDVPKIRAFNSRVSTAVNITPFTGVSLYAAPLVDRRNTIIYE